MFQILNIGGVYSLCDPPADCAGKQPADLVDDQNDCHKFYVCIADGKPTDVSFSCGEGMHFEFGNCTEGADCQNKCDDSSDLGSADNCKLECEANLDFINHKTDCNTYFICLPGGDTQALNCPPELPYFDSAAKNCTTDQSKCCLGCDYTCTDTVEEIADPYDCHSFYTCMGTAGKPDEKFHGTCPTGMIFDAAAHNCAEGETCENTCDGGNPNVTPAPEGTDSPSGITDATGCSESMTCTSEGSFPKCTSCAQEHFYCSPLSINGQAEIRKCAGSLVFNTNPDYAYCVLPENCPYNP